MWSTVCNLDLSKRPTDVSLLWAETLLKAPIHIFVELKRAKNAVRKCPIFAILQQYWLIQSKYLSTKQQKCKHILLVYLSGTENQKSLFTILTDSCIHASFSCCKLCQMSSSSWQMWHDTRLSMEWKLLWYKKLSFLW